MRGNDKRGEAVRSRVEGALERAFETVGASDAPPRLRDGLRHAVFGDGGRVRPSLVVQVAVACGDEHPEAVDAAAAAVELVHCASLVHDDLPAFDDAAVRRGRPTVHAAYGESTAVLVGDGLMMMAFEVLAGVRPAALVPGLVRDLARMTGPVEGIVGGQAWEGEAHVDLGRYHAAKTGALFVAAVRMGALAGGGEPDAWVPLGRAIGAAYQLADDLADRLGGAELGKPVLQDDRHGRPSAVDLFGLDGALRRLEEQIAVAEASVPVVPGRDAFVAWVRAACERLLPARGAVALGA